MLVDPKQSKSQAKSDGEFLQFVPFQVPIEDENVTMMLNVQKIKEVVELDHYTALPKLNGNIIGLYDLRGIPVPVFDILQLMHIAQSVKDLFEQQTFRLLICELHHILIGIPVINTGRLLTCLGSNFLPPPPSRDKNNQQYFSGLVRQGDHYVPVLDIDALLLSIEFDTDVKLNKEDKETDNSHVFKDKRLLLAEDSRVVQQKLTQFFKQLGFQVFAVNNGQEGLQLLDKLEYKIDIVFTDIEMPLLDGIAMARAIKSHPLGQHMRILFNSALSNAALIRDIEQEGLGKYIVKHDEHLIVGALKKILEPARA